jgi:twitching motility protein PilT
MPFVDINSITPKVKPVSTTATDDQTVGEIKEIKGPELIAPAPQNFSTGNLPGAFVDPAPLNTTQSAVETVASQPQPVLEAAPMSMPVEMLTPVTDVSAAVEPAPITMPVEQQVTEVLPTLAEMQVPTPATIADVQIERKEPVPTYTIEPQNQPVIETTGAEQPTVIEPVAPVTVEPVVVSPVMPVIDSSVVPTQPAATVPQQMLTETQGLKTEDLQLNNEVELTRQDMSLDEYLELAISKGASDIHFTVGYRVFLRVNGKFQTVGSPTITAEQTAEYAKLMFEYKGLKNYGRLKDFDMAYQLKGGRFRLNIFKQQGVYGLVFRLIPGDIRSIEQLGLPTIALDFAKLAYGLVLVTGPTGSGKSTTLAAVINYINQTQAKHIITIEDPVEYVYPKGNSLIDQREITQDTDSWDNALKSVLRQDPDVVLVGELRDYETIASAIRVAETGHLVFGTLHTNSAAQTIDRIIDVFPEHQQAQIRVQLANSLQGVISQRLIPLNDGTSRRPAVEILVANDAVRSSIRDNKTHQIDNIIQTGAEFGMVTLEKSLVNLVRGGLISTDKAQEFTNKPDEIVALLRKA